MVGKYVVRARVQGLDWAVLSAMDKVVPWKALLALTEPAYPKAGRGSPTYALETMLRIHLMQNWFGR